MVEENLVLKKIETVFNSNVFTLDKSGQLTLKGEVSTNEETAIMIFFNRTKFPTLTRLGNLSFTNLTKDEIQILKKYKYFPESA